MYWLNLLLDTRLPVCGNAAQRTHGEISYDGPRNLVDSVEYITSRVWQDESGNNRARMVVIQEQQIFAAREVQKGDARPGGYVTTGGHGGLLGGIRHHTGPILTFLPGAKHTYLSEVNRTRLPNAVLGVTHDGSAFKSVEIAIKNVSGDFFETTIPRVSIVKDGNYSSDKWDSGYEREVDILSQIDDHLSHSPLAGFVIEGQSPYGSLTNAIRNKLMLRVVHCGMPVVRVGRGNNLTSTKARLLLIACIMKFGALPPAADPDNPTDAGAAAIMERVGAYQKIFDTH